VLILRLKVGILYNYGLSFAGVELTFIIILIHLNLEDEDRLNIIVILVKDFRRVIRVVKFFLTYDFLSLKSIIMLFRARSVLIIAEVFYPIFLLPKTVLNTMLISGGINY
jgi:hypothetical protein